jgi:hypothetical protein
LETKKKLFVEQVNHRCLRKLRAKQGGLAGLAGPKKKAGLGLHQGSKVEDSRDVGHFVIMMGASQVGNLFV